jgi:hypothetical protein
MNKNIVLVLGILITVLWSGFIFAVPAEVIIIRHGEKPVTGDSLNLKGQERAAALVPYFLHTQALTRYGLPVAVYAEAPRKNATTTRSIQTCTPIAQALGIPVLTSYTKKQYAPLAQGILNNPQYSGKTVLVCWEHKMIPLIINILGVQPMPAPWSDNVFDRTVVITFQPNGKIASYQNLPQRLLYGDSAQ